MANKRMFSLNVVDTDNFIDMPISSRLLYYELGMRADDDGFVGSWKKILLFSGLKEDDMKILITKKFVIPFESGVIVIRHWRMNNYLQNDRTKATIYQEELRNLTIDETNVYNLDTSCIHSIDKYSIEEYSIDKNSIEYIVEQKHDYTAEIIDYLNFKIGSSYRSTTPKTKTLINTRIKEGFSVEDFKTVIDKKYIDWNNNIEMKKYLRPETLFGNKFESYLNQEIRKELKDISLKELEEMDERLFGNI